MVERQYEALRRERLRALEEQNKPSPKMEENDVQPAAPNASSASLSEDQSSQEVLYPEISLEFHNRHKIHTLSFSHVLKKTTSDSLKIQKCYIYLCSIFTFS